MLNALSLLVKPVSGSCNLNCGYCFYSPAEDHHLPRMTQQTAEALITQAFSCAKKVHFGFQGGEPTLAGESFYRRFCDFADTFPAHRATWSIQTNGYAVSEALIELLKEKNFLVGLSLDGPRGVHDKYRRTPSGASSFPAVCATLERLKQNGVPVNLLSVVTQKTCAHPEEVWRFLASLGVPCLQFILCLDSAPGHPFAPEVSAYGRFLNATFRLWAGEIYRGNYISERFFDNCVQVALGKAPELCQQTGACKPQLVVEADGSVYPCDFYVTPSCCCGNIHRQSLQEILASPVFGRFVADRGPAHPECGVCPWRRFCGGGCRRTFSTENRTAYCAAYRQFFEQNMADIYRIAGMAATGNVRSRYH